MWSLWDCSCFDWVSFGHFQVIFAFLCSCFWVSCSCNHLACLFWPLNPVVFIWLTFFQLVLTAWAWWVCLVILPWLEQRIMNYSRFLFFRCCIADSCLCVFLYSGKIKSVSDSFRNKLHRVHQRLLRHGETTGQQFVPASLKGSSALFMN